jgi:hypothetical protein
VQYLTSGDYVKKPSSPARAPELQALMSLKAMLNRKKRVRDRKVAEMDAAIADLEVNVATAEKGYAAFKRKKPKR